MKSWTIRELKAKLSEALRLVDAGESIVVTNRGQPAATLGPVVTSAPKPTKRGKPAPATGTPSAEDEGLVVLRYLLKVQLEAVQSSGDERTQTQAAKEARTLTEKIGAITGDLRPLDAKGDLARFERMSPSELLIVIEEWAEELRKVVADE